MNAWDARLYEVARVVASWSKDPKRRVGAVLTRDKGHALYAGYNGLPATMSDDLEVLNDRERRLARTVHAEVNAILHLPNVGGAWHAYVTEHPCQQCALLLIAGGATRVTCPEPRRSSRWFESQKFASVLFGEAGVVEVNV